MRQCKLSSILYSGFAITVFSSCSSGPMPVYPNHESGETSSYAERKDLNYQKSVFSNYCKGGRQVKKYAINVRFIKPRAPIGTPVDKINLSLQNVLNDEHDIFSRAFSKLSTIGSCDKDVGHHCLPSYLDEIFFKTSDSFETVSNFAKSVKNLGESDEKYGSNMQMLPMFVKANDSDKIIFFFEKSANDNNDTTYWPTKYGKGHYSQGTAYLAELNALKTGFTMMVPKEVQEDTFHAKAGCKASRCREGGAYYSNGLEGFDEDVEPITLTPTAALRDQKDIWERYFATFTSIKESATNDPQVTDYEFSLDLNHFCKYARNIDDLVAH